MNSLESEKKSLEKSLEKVKEQVELIKKHDACFFELFFEFDGDNNKYDMEMVLDDHDKDEFMQLYLIQAKKWIQSCEEIIKTIQVRIENNEQDA